VQKQTTRYYQRNRRGHQRCDAFLQKHNFPQHSSHQPLLWKQKTILAKERFQYFIERSAQDRHFSTQKYFSLGSNLTTVMKILFYSFSRASGFRVIFFLENMKPSELLSKANYQNKSKTVFFYRGSAEPLCSTNHVVGSVAILRGSGWAMPPYFWLTPVWPQIFS